MDKRVKDIIDKSGSVVFFGGAGVSTESNIPDFRSEKGLYSAMSEYGYSPEQMLSHTFFTDKMEVFFDYYKKNLIYPMPSLTKRIWRWQGWSRRANSREL